MKYIISSLLFIILVYGFVTADELPENKKKISYGFEVTNMESFPDYIFLAYPVNTSGGVTYIQCKQLLTGKTVYLPCKFGPAPNIYAINKDLYNPEIFKVKDNNSDKFLDSLFENNKDFIPSLKISCTGYAEKSAPYSEIKDQLKIESITADTMIIKLEKTLFMDNKGKVIDESKGGLLDDLNGRNGNNYFYYSLPFISLVLIVSIVIIRKMKK